MASERKMRLGTFLAGRRPIALPKHLGQSGVGDQGARDGYRIATAVSDDRSDHVAVLESASTHDGHGHVGLNHTREFGIDAFEKKYENMIRTVMSVFDPPTYHGT